ncbi:MAG: methyltransferase family protein [Terracidiphilus sp.]
MKLNIATLGVFTVALAFFAAHASRFAWDPARIAGFAIAIPAFLLLVLARIQLGRAFSVRAKANTLVTTGLYSRIRNPIYVFGSLMILGIVVWTEHPWLFLVFAVLIPLQVRRSRKEGQALAEKFGAEYLEYKQKTWF